MTPQTRRDLALILTTLVDVLMVVALLVNAWRGETAMCVALGSLLIVIAIDRTAKRR